MIQNCQLCPRSCSVDRTSGNTGYCGAGKDLKIYSYSPHHGEEPPISGTGGSGTIFFSHCTVSCIYCQNYQFSQEGGGSFYTVDELVEIFRSLYRKGCHNWNLVSPTPWMSLIREALVQIKHDGIMLPVVYNTSGFEKVEVLKEYRDDIDIYLPDLRYSRDETALEGSGVNEYVVTARGAIREMCAQAGELVLDEEGIARSGVIIRMLILPGRANELIENLEWIAREVGTEVSLSVMAQYMPTYKALDSETWNRPVSQREYDVVSDAMDSMGFSNGWLQEYGRAPSTELVGFMMSKKEKV